MDPIKELLVSGEWRLAGYHLQQKDQNENICKIWKCLMVNDYPQMHLYLERESDLFQVHLMKQVVKMLSDTCKSLSEEQVTFFIGRYRDAISHWDFKDGFYFPTKQVGALPRKEDLVAVKEALLNSKE